MKYSRGEIIKIILKILLAGTIVVGAAIIAPGIGPVLKMFIPRKKYARGKFSRTLYNLEKQKLVSISHKGKETVVTITEKGRQRALRYNLEDLFIKKPKSWDGYWRVIIFDIPNTKTHRRNLLRMRLKEIGFKMIQKSTFVIPYPAKNEVNFIGEYLGIRKYITYMLVKEIEGSKNLRQAFKI